MKTSDDDRPITMRRGEVRAWCRERDELRAERDSMRELCKDVAALLAAAETALCGIAWRSVRDGWLRRWRDFQDAVNRG